MDFKAKARELAETNEDYLRGITHAELIEEGLRAAYASGMRTCALDIDDPEHDWTNGETAEWWMARADAMARALLALLTCDPTHDWEPEFFEAHENARAILRDAGVIP